MPKQTVTRPYPIVLLLAWTLFAFAGAIHWTAVPLIAGAIVLIIVRRPRVADASTRSLDVILIACIAAVAAQLVPLAPTIREALAPAAVAFDRAQRLDTPTAVARPLSIDPAATSWALAVGASMVLLFWCARASLARGGVRTLARAIAGCGFVLAPLVIVQRHTAPGQLLWLWPPSASNALPYGPFVNRNDLACWLIMAIPVATGYTVARIEAVRQQSRVLDVEAAVDATTVWLGASVALMTSLLFVTMSRSGLTGAVAGFSLLIWLSRTRLARQPATWVMSALAAMAFIATTYANLGALGSRLGDALTEGVGGRTAIWRTTWPMVRDFWPAGVGVGGYERGMVLYQPIPHLFYFNHAHNEYLQLLAEGGAPLIALIAAAAGIVVWMIAQRLAADRSPAFWIRAGAASGMAAVAVQSVWETGLRIPANAVLFAVAAAIALHDRQG